VGELEFRDENGATWATLSLGMAFIGEGSDPRMPLSDGQRRAIKEGVEKERREDEPRRQVAAQELETLRFTLARRGWEPMTVAERANQVHQQWDAVDRRAAAAERRAAEEAGRPVPVHVAPAKPQVADPVEVARQQQAKRRRWRRGRSARSEAQPRPSPEGSTSQVQQYLHTCEEMGVQPDPEDVRYFAAEDAADNGTEPGRSRRPAGVSYR
jgi:hypothetical protein